LLVGVEADEVGHLLDGHERGLQQLDQRHDVADVVLQRSAGVAAVSVTSPPLE
jgi:hypothetical protein